MYDIQQAEGADPADEPVVEFSLFMIAVKAPITLEDRFVLRACGAETSVQVCFSVADLTEGVFTKSVRGGLPEGIARNFR